MKDPVHRVRKPNHGKRHPCYRDGANFPLAADAEHVTCEKCLLNLAMTELAARPGAVFVGQGVAADGVATYDDLDGIPLTQRVEFPVAENLQMGYGTGLALLGYLPVLVYPRIDFMLLALDQLVNHLDKLEEMSCGQWQPKVIIRTRVGTRRPLDAGPQHTQNHAAAFRRMLTNVDVVSLVRPNQIVPAYRRAAESMRSTVIVEDLQ